MSKLYHHVPLRTSQHLPQNVNVLHKAQMSTGDLVADRVANVIGSWHFIITQALILVLWFTLNSVSWFFHWDGYPFILCNLFMSAEAAFATPLVLMSQNRQSARDRIQAEEDYHTNVKAEHEVLQVLSHLDAQDQKILDIDTKILQILTRMEKSS